MLMRPFSIRRFVIGLTWTVVLFAPWTSKADETLKAILKLPPQTEDRTLIDGFAVFGGDWKLDDGGVSIAAQDGPKLVCVGPEFQEMKRGEVSVEMFIPGTPHQYSNAGIILKVREPGIGADSFIGYEIAPSPENRHVNIGLHRNDYRPLQQPACDLPTDRWFLLHVLFEETSFEVRVDDKTITQYEDTSPDAVRSGGIALRAWQRSAQYRNLKIRNTTDERLPGEWTAIPLRAPDLRAEKNDAWPETLDVSKLPPILFLTRHPLHQPPAVGQDLTQNPFAPGCSIRIMDPARPDEKIKTIFEDPEGCIYDMNLSLDARTVFFSYRRRGERHWNLWSVGIDGKNPRQLTSGPSYDVSPCETPEGDLVFVSTRRYGHTVCQPGPASNLFRLRGWKEGEPTIACVSMNTLSDMSPQLLDDGRVLFTRWEYIDRDLTYRQSLWTQNPDGTNYQLFFGNTIRDVGTFWQARQLPGHPRKLIATFAPHHGYPHGMIGLVDRDQGIEGEKGKAFVYITTEVPSVGDRNMPWAYRDPFPVTDETFLCAYGDGPGFFRDGKKRFALYLLDRYGEKRLLYEDVEQSCFFPIPLEPRSDIPVIPDRSRPVPAEMLTNPDDESLRGTVILTNVYEGLQGKVEPGTIVALRIIEQVRKTEDIVHRAYDQSPVMSYGTYYAKRDWGTVPVEKDGSAHFQVPALREIYLQALDAEGREIQRMTSAMQLMVGEQLSCTGCHEDRDSAPLRSRQMPLAARKTPKIPETPDWLLRRKPLNPYPDPRIFDYPTVVQPVLDKYCISCHHGEKADGGYDLTGDKTRFFSMSYDNLLGTSRSYRQHNMQTGAMLPDEAAKGKPLVHFFWLLWTPTSVNEPYLTGSHASRLTELIESDHAGVEIPLEDRQKIYYWIDADVPYYSTYASARPHAAGRRDRFAEPDSGGYSSWFSERFSEVYNRRCTECHESFDYPMHTGWTGRYSWVNLSRPQFSPALTAHLPKKFGGRGIAAVKDGPRRETADVELLLFKDRNDPDFQKMFDAIEEGRRIMEEHPEADMPGFRRSRAEP